MPSSLSAAPAPIAAWIGVDWADQHHDLSLREADTDRIERQRILATPEAIQEWVASLRQRFGGRPVALCLEQSRGPLMYTLMEHDFLVLYPINPATLDRFRKAFASSGAKSDAADADRLREILEKHRVHLHAWTPDDPETRTLARLVRARRKAVDLHTKLMQRLRAELKDYFPQALAWAGTDLSAPMAWDFLRRWPTLAAVKRAREKTLRDFYTAHRCRSPKIIDQRLAQVRRAVPLVTDSAIIDPAVLTVQMLVGQLRPLNESITAYDERIEALFTSHPDAPLFTHLPGSGPALAPRLLCAFGTDRTRFASAAEIQQYSGIAPVCVASGKSRWVHRRWAAPPFLRQSFHEFAGHSIRYSMWARAYYDQLRERGQSHHAAVRALAFKWIRILWRCWQDRVPYSETRYLQALRGRGSPLAERLPASAP